MQGLQANTMQGIYSSRGAYLSMTEVQNVAQNGNLAYDQYEVMRACMARALNLVLFPDQPNRLLLSTYHDG